MRRGHVYLPGEEVLPSSEHLSLRGEHPKFFPKFVSPFVIKELRGINMVGLQVPPETRFGLIDTVVNIDRLHPYKRRPPQLGSSEEDDQSEALVIDPRGDTWWEVEDVMAHRHQRHGRRFFLWEVASGQLGHTLAAPRAAEKLRTGSESGVDSRWGGTFATPI
jgi:hypothetical protein